MLVAADFLSRHRRERVAILADRLVVIVQSASPGYREGDRVSTEDLRRSCSDNIDRVLELLTLALTGVRPDDEMYDAARATGCRRSEQGLQDLRGEHLGRTRLV